MGDKIYRWLLFASVPLLLGTLVYSLFTRLGMDSQTLFTGFYMGGFVFVAVMLLLVAYYIPHPFGQVQALHLTLFLLGTCFLNATALLGVGVYEGTSLALLYPVSGTLMLWTHIRMTAALVTDLQKQIRNVIHLAFFVPNVVLLVPLLLIGPGAARVDWYLLASQVKDVHGALWGIFSFGILLLGAIHAKSTGERMRMVALLPMSAMIVATLVSWAVDTQLSVEAFRVGGACVSWMVFAFVVSIAARDVEIYRRSEYLDLITASALNAIDDGLVVLDNDLRVTRVNGAMERIVGIPASEMEGRSTMDVLSRITVDVGLRTAMDVFRKLLNGERCEMHIHEIRNARTGAVSRIAMAGTRLVDAKGELHGVGLVFHNLTGILEMRELLQQEQRMNTFGRLVSGVAHEFKNTLGSIGGLSDLLKKSLSEEKTDMELARTLADEISVALRDTGDLGGKLLDFVRNHKIVYARLDAELLVEQALQFARLNRRTDIEVVRDFRADRRFVSGDRVTLQNAFLNLFLNACDAMPAGGVLTVETHNVHADREMESWIGGRKLAAGDYVEVVVKDTGAGVSEELLRKVFEPAFTTKEAKGSGFGLSMVRTTIAEHRGDILLESAAGKGATFRVLLPVWSEENDAVPATVA